MANGYRYIVHFCPAPVSSQQPLGRVPPGDLALLIQVLVGMLDVAGLQRAEVSVVGRKDARCGSMWEGMGIQEGSHTRRVGPNTGGGGVTPHTQIRYSSEFGV